LKRLFAATMYVFVSGAAGAGRRYLTCTDAAPAFGFCTR
jgi:hypothetical protein